MCYNLRLDCTFSCPEDGRGPPVLHRHVISGQRGVHFWRRRGGGGEEETAECFRYRWVRDILYISDSISHAGTFTRGCLPVIVPFLLTDLTEASKPLRDRSAAADSLAGSADVSGADKKEAKETEDAKGE